MKTKILKLALLGSVFFAACDKAPIESEQYQKLIYLVGAQDITRTVELEYSNKPVETFVSVSSSGSLNIDKDVQVKLSNPLSIIESYNDKYFEADDTESFLKPIKTELFELPNKDNLWIKSSEEIFARQAILIQTANLHTDSVHAIPITIDHVSEYEVNPKLKELILLVKLKNNFSGNYGMLGTRKHLGNNSIANLQKNKVLKATAINQLRMYIGDVSEVNTTRDSQTVLLTINEDNTIQVSPWSSLQDVSGSGTYDPDNKTITLTYRYTLNAVTYEVHETLSYIN
ncbi:BT_3044 domain-containing protein [Sphingobacterium kyonggiense]